MPYIILTVKSSVSAHKFVSELLTHGQAMHKKFLTLSLVRKSPLSLLISIMFNIISLRRGYLAGCSFFWGVGGDAAPILEAHDVVAIRVVEIVMAFPGCVML